MMLLDRAIAGQAVAFTLEDKASGNPLTSPAGVTARRILDGVVAPCTGAVTVADGRALLFTGSAADCDGARGCWILDHASARGPFLVNFRTAADTARALFRTPLSRRALAGVPAAELEYADGIAAALLGLIGNQTSPDLSAVNPVIHTTFPGDATVVYTTTAGGPVIDYRTDRGFQRFRQMRPARRNLQGVTDGTVDDALAGMQALVWGDEDKTGNLYTRKYPDGSTVVVFTFDSATTPTRRTRNP